MKKLAVAVLTGTMVLGLGANVYAAEFPSSATHDVKASYTATTTADKKYSVDITWGNMEYTYTVENEGKWNPETHKYDNASEGGKWSCEENANKVTVTNHSNAGVKADFAYKAEENFNGISGQFSEESATLDTAEGTEVESAPKKDVTLSLTGALNKNVENNTKIGTATVTLSEVQ